MGSDPRPGTGRRSDRRYSVSSARSGRGCGTGAPRGTRVRNLPRWSDPAPGIPIRPFRAAERYSGEDRDLRRGRSEHSRMGGCLGFAKGSPLYRRIPAGRPGYGPLARSPHRARSGPEPRPGPCQSPRLDGIRAPSAGGGPWPGRGAFRSGAIPGQRCLLALRVRLLSALAVPIRGGHRDRSTSGGPVSFLRTLARALGHERSLRRAPRGGDSSGPRRPRQAPPVRCPPFEILRFP